MATINSDGIVLDCKWNDTNILSSEEVVITERDLQIMLDAVPTIESWVIEALVGRIAHHKKVMLEAHRATYFSDPTVNTDDEVIAAVFAAEGYQTRAEIDAADVGEF